MCSAWSGILFLFEKQNCLSFTRSRTWGIRKHKILYLLPEMMRKVRKKLSDADFIDSAKLPLPGKCDTPGEVVMKRLEKEKKSGGFSGFRTEKNENKFLKWVEKCLQYAEKLCIIVKLSV